MIKSEKKNKRTAIIYWLFTISYMGIIFFFSSRKGTDLPDLPQGLDKVLHLCSYVLLAFLIYLSLNKSRGKKYVFMLAFLSATFYGITVEFHQVFVPGRDASIGDVLANSFGAFLGCYLATVVNTYRCRSE